ncbi:MAG: TRAP transporter substrate-binding protein DctP [Proteobacteria bacterium]|nr:TRAP transporter substrate-binding protein DctP [Pseudomonadota bacterium]
MTLRPKSVFALILCALACLASAPEVAAEASITWKMATLAPENIGWARHIKETVMPAIMKTTGGDLYIKVYWGGVMGDDEDVIRKMEQGILQGAGLTAQGTTQMVPEMSVVSLPFLFNNYEEVDYIKEKMTSTFDLLIQKRGYSLLAWTDQDFDEVFSLKYDMSRLEHYAMSRMVQWNGPLENELLRELGATVVPVDVPDLSQTVRRGLVDAAIGPGVWVVGAQLHNIVKYVSPIRIRYGPATIVVTQQVWAELPKVHQKEFFAQRQGIMEQFCRDVRVDNEKYLNAMLEYGVVKVEMKPEDLALMKEKTRKIWDRMAGVLYPREVLDELLGHLKDYRAAHPGSGS